MEAPTPRTQQQLRVLGGSVHVCVSWRRGCGSSLFLGAALRMVELLFACLWGCVGGDWEYTDA